MQNLTFWQKSSNRPPHTESPCFSSMKLFQNVFWLYGRDPFQSTDKLSDDVDLPHVTQFLFVTPFFRQSSGPKFFLERTQMPIPQHLQIEGAASPFVQ